MTNIQTIPAEGKRPTGIPDDPQESAEKLQLEAALVCCSQQI